MRKISVTEDDFQIIEAIKGNTDFKTDESAVALLTEIFLVPLIAPEKVSIIVDLLNESRFSKLRKNARAAYSIGSQAKKKNLS